MYKLLHKLFGWDYLYWWNNADQGIARVHTTPGGVAYYWRYTNISLMGIINENSRVVFLTCKPEKYLNT